MFSEVKLRRGQADILIRDPLMIVELWVTKPSKPCPTMWVGTLSPQLTAGDQLLAHGCYRIPVDPDPGWSSRSEKHEVLNYVKSLSIVIKALGGVCWRGNLLDEDHSWIRIQTPMVVHGWFEWPSVYRTISLDLYLSPHITTCSRAWNGRWFSRWRHWTVDRISIYFL